MKITYERSGFEKIKADAYLFLCYEDKNLFEEQIKNIQKILKTKITELNLVDFKGKYGQAALIYTSKCRIILSGLGKKENISIEKIRVGVSRILKKAISLKIKKVAIEVLNDDSLPGGILEVARAEAIGCILGNYHFTKYFTGKDKKDESTIKQAVFFADKKLIEKYQRDIEKGIKTGGIIGNATNFARDLGNEPSNVLYPEYYSNLIKERSGNEKYTVEVLELEEIEKLGMGAVIEVAKGSKHDPRFMIIRYNGGEDGDKPYVIIGKGVTFDSGGISLKPPAGMAMMKLDMCGSAAAVGIIEAVSKLGLKLNLIGLIPIVENMPDGNSLKPGDVITAFNGKTIEIDNTDAEGRLILADALSYAAEFKPKVVIDLATLTGAVVVALGNVTSAIMGNDQELIDKLFKAGLETYDRVWQLPLFEEYDKLIDSDIADVKNGGTGRQAGSITAAMFLQRFIGNYSWVHIDIAGTAMRDSKQDFLPKYATGAGVRLVTQYLMNEENEKLSS